MTTDTLTLDVSAESPDPEWNVRNARRLKAASRY
jgi:hypothetical protein